MTDTVDQSTIVQYITDTFAGVDVVVGADGIAAGDTFFSYDPNLDLEPQRRMPFATIVTKDYGEFDCSSKDVPIRAARRHRGRCSVARRWRRAQSRSRPRRR